MGIMKPPENVYRLSDNYCNMHWLCKGDFDGTASYSHLYKSKRRGLRRGTTISGYVSKMYIKHPPVNEG